MDSICINMPHSLRDFLLATAIVQSYSLEQAALAQRGEKEKHYLITIRMHEQFKYFDPVLRVVKDNIPVFDYSGWEEWQRGEFDCFINFDFPRAEKIANKVGMHITNGFNTLIGCGAGQWPILAALQLPEPDKDLQTDILVIPWGDGKEAEKFYEYMLDNYNELEVIIDNRDMQKFENDPKSYIDYINNFRIVIGQASTATYIAATLKKSVIEFFQSNEQGVLYGNSGLDKYRAIVGKNVTANFLFTVWEDLCQEERTSIMKTVEESEQMVSGVSSADNVEEK
jgi:hypothetical protein